MTTKRKFFNTLFKDREDAGRRLARRLKKIRDKPDAVVVGLPRGGIIVAKEVALDLGLPLEIIIVKKIGLPGDPELAIGAVAEGMRIIDWKAVKGFGISDDYIEEETIKANREIRRRAEIYRHGRPLFDLSGKTVVVIDDGLATGATMSAAIDYAKTVMGARKIIVSVPVASRDAIRKISGRVDKAISLNTIGGHSFSVGEYYLDFPQVSDKEVISALGVVSGAIN